MCCALSIANALTLASPIRANLDHEPNRPVLVVTLSGSPPKNPRARMMVSYDTYGFSFFRVVGATTSCSCCHHDHRMWCGWMSKRGTGYPPVTLTLHPYFCCFLICCILTCLWGSIPRYSLHIVFLDLFMGYLCFFRLAMWRGGLTLHDLETRAANFQGS